MNQPHINVTPLIDVLLVLLIIFMVVTPMKPSAFEARVPAEPTEDPGVKPNPDTIVVSVDKASGLALNNRTVGATVAEPERLIGELSAIFAARQRHNSFVEGTTEIQRTVFVKAPRGLDYGSVAKVVDAVKMGGARPISLQIDDLD